MNDIVKFIDGEIEIETKVESETVWITQKQMCELFGTAKSTVSEHLKNIFESGELDKNLTVRNFRTVRMEGNRKVSRNIEYYNLDVIISVGYRVNSKKATKFRQWATKVLKDYILKGYALNQKRIEQNFEEFKQKIEHLQRAIKQNLNEIEVMGFDNQTYNESNR
jgi:hypothetical protein